MSDNDNIKSKADEDDGRVHRSVGSLLSSMGTKDGFKPTTPPPLPEPDHKRYERKQNKELTSWAELRMYDDEFTKEWMKEEQYRVDDLYFGHFIKVQYTTQNSIGYYCELCLSEMNGEKSLESHCAGMKHLKKKDIHEKNLKDQENGISNNCPIKAKKQFKQEKKDKKDTWNREDKRGTWVAQSKGAPPPPSIGGDFSRRDRFETRAGGWAGRGDRDPFDDFAMGRNAGRPAEMDPYMSRRSPGLKLASGNSLAGSPTGALIQKLADCSVNNEGDADLAINVVSSLVKSLKDYNTRRGDLKVADLYMDAELKLSTVKAIKVGMKMGVTLNPLGNATSRLGGFPYNQGQSSLRAPSPPSFSGFPSHTRFGSAYR